ncbi:hypothetical protein [Ancylobacter sp. FA202]|uniref:hypothetical protein n=1 Tax=Ancylobacter sp. FA202 TaxID=1111106 RepID=UPI00036727B3|nr:hypothetical protein [Ancylobacter sp. FA202]
MRSVITIIEQLDRALSELAINHPLNGRIALILVDNGLELMCHVKCTDLLADDRGRTPRGLTQEQRNDARGRAFDRKLGLLRDLGHIRAEQAQAITTLHGYRNQLYHVGLRDDPVIGQLAHLYFHLAAELLEPLLGTQRHLGWEPEIITDAARRLLPELATAKRYGAKVDIAGLRARWVAECPSPPAPIEQALSRHLLARVDEAEASFSIIARGRSGTDDPTATLRTVQLEADTLTAIRRHRRDHDKQLKAKGLEPKPLDDEQLAMARGMRVLEDLNARLLPNWTPKHPILPFNSWRKQATSISTKRKAYIALGSFDRIRREIDQLEDIMAEPIEDMCGWHQYLEDVAMDNR